MVGSTKKYFWLVLFLLLASVVFLISYFAINNFNQRYITVNNNHSDYQLEFDKSGLRNAVRTIFDEKNTSLVINVTNQIQPNLIKQKIDTGEIIPLIGYDLNKIQDTLVLDLYLDRTNILLSGITQQSLNQKVEFVIYRSLIIYQLTSSGQIDDSDYQNIIDQTDNIQEQAREIYKQQLNKEGRGIFTLNEKSN